MKRYLGILVLAIGLLGSGHLASAQGLLGLGASGLTGLPDTTHFGDTIKNMQVWIVNRGILPLSNVLVDVLASPNQGLPIQLGQLDLTLGLLAPGDSVQVPLDDYTVTTQNSNSGSNVILIWPTAPGTQPEDSAGGTYWVDAITGTVEAQAKKIQLYPNPGNGIFHFQAPFPLVGCLMEVYACDGKMVSQGHLNSTGILDLSGLQEGLYFYQVAYQNQRKGGKIFIDKN